MHQRRRVIGPTILAATLYCLCAVCAEPNREAIARVKAILARISQEIFDNFHQSAVTDVFVYPNELAGRPTKICISPKSWEDLEAGSGKGAVPCSASDDDLAVIAAVGELKSLTVNRARITDAGLHHLRTLLQLEELDLAQNSLTDAGLKHLEPLRHLQHLNLQETAVTDKGLRQLSLFKEMKSLGLGGKATITAEGIQYIVETFPGLETILLCGSAVTDESLKRVKRLPKLKTVTLRDAGAMTPTGVGYLSEIPSLESLTVADSWDVFHEELLTPLRTTRPDITVQVLKGNEGD